MLEDYEDMDREAAWVRGLLRGDIVTEVVSVSEASATVRQHIPEAALLLVVRCVSGPMTLALTRSALRRLAESLPMWDHAMAEEVGDDKTP